jgi:putative iron-regulated protein
MHRAIVLCSLVALGGWAPQVAPPRPHPPRIEDPLDPALETRLLANYAELARARYAAIQAAAVQLADSLTRLAAEPSAEGLALARQAWCRARELYGTSEALRFYGGPIDDPRNGVEALLNAWPLDELYLDGYPSAPGTGLVGDAALLPHLDPRALELLNQRGGETHVATGWHAIEFLLWGVDQDPSGPGQRSHTDFVAGAAPHAERRAELLRVLGQLLVEHLEQVQRAWSEDPGAYRQRFVADVDGRSLRNVLAGLVVLSGFELAGERLVVALETRDQEQEHSCFSDTTHADLIADQRGILEVWHGRLCEELHGPTSAAGTGLAELVEALDPALAKAIEAQLEATLLAVEAIPAPFDQAILGADEDPGRRAVWAAVVAFEQQTRLLSALAGRLGFSIQLVPGG